MRFYSEGNGLIMGSGYMAFRKGKAEKVTRSGGNSGMTLKELSQLYYLNREIEMDRRRLEGLRTRAESPGSPRFDGMPHVKSTVSKVERYAVEIAGLEAIIAAKQEQCIHERNRLERYISDIDDSRLRIIFKLRFVKGLSWWQVAAHIGGNNTGDSVRMAVQRFLSKK